MPVAMWDRVFTFRRRNGSADRSDGPCVTGLPRSLTQVARAAWRDPFFHRSMAAPFLSGFTYQAAPPAPTPMVSSALPILAAEAAVRVKRSPFHSLQH